MDLANKSELIKYLKQNELWAKKSLGQNFLVDRNVLNKIVEVAELKKTDTVIEIGPGFGVLTQELVKNAGKIIAIEKDDELAKKLDVRCQMSDVKNIEIINQDALESDINDMIDCHPEFISGSQGVSGSRNEFGMTRTSDSSAKDSSFAKATADRQNDKKEITYKLQAKSYKLVANIPYYITSKILEKFLAAENKPELIVLLVQKEVAERICAQPGDTSVLSIAVQFYGEPEIVDIVKSNSFFPQPSIDSAILKVKLKSQSSNLKNMEKDLFKTVRAGFRSRRKTLVNNLISGTNLSREELFDILEKIGLDRNVRAQELAVEQWIQLTNLTQTSNLKT